MTTQNIDVANVANDDGWMYFGSAQNNGIWNNCGHYAGVTHSDIWMRFKVTTTIAQGSTFSSAILRQRAAETNSASGFTATVKCNKVSNAADVTDGAQLDGRTYCTATVTLTDIAITNGSNYDIDVAAIMNELSAYTALAANDYILFVIEDTGSTGGIYRVFDSRDNGNYTSLRLTYTLTVNDVLTASVGAFTLTGVAAAINSLSHACSVGAFTLTGVDAGINSLSHPCNVAAFDLTGVDCLNSINHVADVGAFTLTGVAAGINNLSHPCGAGAYTYTGVDCLNSITFVCGTGVYVLTGYDIIEALDCDTGAYTLTGVDAAMRWNQCLLAEAAGTNNVYDLVCSFNLGGDFVLSCPVLSDNTPTISYDGLDGNALGVLIENAINAKLTSSGYGGECVVTITDPTPTFTTGAITFKPARSDIFLSVWSQTPNGLGSLLIFETIAGDPGFVLSGKTIGWNVRIAGVAGAYTLTGVAATLAYSTATVCDVGTYTLTGVSVLTAIGIDCDSGAYTLTGVSARLYLRSTTPLAAGAYTLTGTDVAFIRAWILSGGAYTLTGNATAFGVGMPAAVAAFVLAGNAASLTHFGLIVGAQGTYSLTGIDAALKLATSIDFDAGAYTLSGIAATLRWIAAPIVADAGAYSLTGVAAALRATTQIESDHGQFLLTGVAADWTINRVIAASAGVYTLSGVDAALRWGKTTAADTGAYTLTGVAAGTLAQYASAGGAGLFTLTGGAAAFHRGIVIAAEFGTFVFTGNVTPLNLYSPVGAGAYVLTGVTTSTHTRTPAGETEYTFAGIAAALRYSTLTIADAGAYTLTGVAAGLQSEFFIAADAGAYTLTGVAALFRYAYVIHAERGEYALTGIAATLTFAGVNCSPTGLVEIIPAYICAVHIVNSYTLTIAVQSAYTAIVNVNGASVVMHGETPLRIGEPNDVNIYDFARRSTAAFQNAEAPTFDIVNVATGNIVTGCEDIAMVSTSATGDYLGTSPAVPEIADASISDAGFQRDAPYRVDVYADGKLYRQIDCIAKVASFI